MTGPCAPCCAGLFARGYNDSAPHYTYDLVDPGETQVCRLVPESTDLGPTRQQWQTTQ